ncbi:hypothetical protein HGB13_00125 [bacterium]|nr:hypothetical protein [bacterium]
MTIKQKETEMLNDCWSYHKLLLKGDNPEFNRKELKGQIYDLSLENYEDVGYFVGYLRALDDMARGEIKPNNDNTKQKAKEEKKINKHIRRKESIYTKLF